MSYVNLEKVGKKYPDSDTLSVQNFSLDIKQGEFIVFVGPSGCGKSTTLRMIAGLEAISEGTVSIEGNVVNDVHPKNRDIAMVFQNYALYPHMSVEDNITFGLKMQKTSKEEIAKKVEWASDILGLKEYLDRKPKDLSGGQRQRVALGRAIVRNPKVFLMDEPLSNLDAKLRVSMRNEITKLHRSLGATTIYVTHDQIEAMTMADRIVVMKDGEIQQIGTPMELYHTPANLFVAGFIGAPKMNTFEVEVENGIVKLNGFNNIPLPEGILKKTNLENGKYTMGIRPEHMKVDKITLDAYPEEVIEIEVQNIEKMGSENFIFSNIGGHEIILKVPAREDAEIGEKVKFRMDINKVHFFDFETEKSVSK
ncbi:MAG: ABC transporter ATP-binding protein [Mycoplasmatales bacterium]